MKAKRDLEAKKRKALKKAQKRKVRRNLIMVLFTGLTVEEAIQKGLNELNIRE